jgi:hypothetical protein
MNTTTKYAELDAILANRIHRDESDLMRAVQLADELGEFETRDDLQELIDDCDI